MDEIKTETKDEVKAGLTDVVKIEYIDPERAIFTEKNGFISTGYIIHAYGVDYEILTTSPYFKYEEYIGVFKNNGFDKFTPTIVRKPD